MDTEPNVMKPYVLGLIAGTLLRHGDDQLLVTSHGPWGIHVRDATGQLYALTLETVAEPE